MRSPEDFPADIIAAAEDAFDKLLCNDTESCGGAAGLRRAAIEDIARALMERDRAATERAAKFTEDDIWLLASAAENLRGGSQNEERRVEAAFRIAFKLDELRKRMSQP
jgi:hypothetical protein